MASQSNVDFPPQPPSSDGYPTVVVIVFVSIGGVFFTLVLAAAIFCFLKKCKNKKKTCQKTEAVHIDEHKKMKEVIVEGPHGTQSVVITVQDDIHVGEKIDKKASVEESLNDKSVAEQRNASSTSVANSAPPS